MSANDFYTPTDIDALRMENELLAFEIRFLKARLTDSERSVEQLQERLAKSERSVEQLQERLAKSERSAARLRRRLAKAKRSSMSPQRRAQLKNAEKDLVMLLRSMANSPFHRLFKIKKTYRDLEQRYL